MSDIKSPPAFPTTTSNHTFKDNAGMSLRDYFAAQVMGSLQTYFSNSLALVRHPEAVAKWAYKIADAMLEAREKND